MLMLLSVIAAVVFLYVVVYYVVFRGARCSSSAKLKGKTVIVTGNDSQPVNTSNKHNVLSML